MTCHQGRTAGNDVVEAIAGLDVERPNPELRFINPHYATAAATWLGGYGGSGYHYDGKDYSGRFFHARPVASCNSCHEPHTLEVAFEPCLTCHQADARRASASPGKAMTAAAIRRRASGQTSWPMPTRCWSMIKAYSAEVAQVPMRL